MSTTKTRLIRSVLCPLFALLSLGCLSATKSAVKHFDGNDIIQTSGTLTGTASWYGGSFHGRMTANGETYNMYELTAAHKTLPFGTLLRVTNLSNQKKMFVRVNDRGPFIPGRILDLSYGAARELGMVESGIKRVKIEILSLSARASRKKEMGS